MKHLRYFEKNTIKPQIGDYVLMKSQATGGVEIFIDKNIGKIISYYGSEGIYVKYPKNKFFLDNRLFNISQIIEISPDKKDLESILNSRKYNL